MNISTIGLKEFTDLVVTKLEELKRTFTIEIVLQNPDADGVFPCLVVRTPLRYDEKNSECIPVYSRFSVVIECWTKKKYDSLEWNDKVDSKLREINFIRVGTPVDFYDEITKTHRVGGQYEVFFNGLTNALEKIK